MFLEAAQTSQQRLLTDDAQDYVRLTERKRAVQRDLNEVNERLRVVETNVIDGMLAAQVQNLTILGYTVYVRNQLYARAKDGDHVRLVRALLDGGREDLIVMGVQRLKGELRDEETLAGLPETIRDALEVQTEPRLGCRKSGD